MNFLSFNNVEFYIAIGLSLANGVLMCFACYKFLQIIQLSGYKLKGYFLWLKDTKASYVSRIIMLSILSTFCVLVTNSLFNVYQENALYSYLGLIFYFYFTIVFINNLYTAPKKVPLKNTARMTRLNIILFFSVSILSFFMIAISTEYLGFIKFGALCFVPLFMPLLVPLVHLITVPLENLIIKNYMISAKAKLKKLPDLIKIGITGSFGKTSTKYILNTILSEKFKVCMSPHSFNTPTGLSKVVNDYLKEDDNILIAEMGARNVGDIRKLCRFIRPVYGIITGVGSQHLLSFKTLDNILNTKFELVEELPKDNAVAIFNGDNEGAMKLFERCTISKKVVGNLQKDSKIKADNISYTADGTKFVLKVDDEKLNCFTKLIGEHNVQNILLCVQMAKILGLTNEQIVSGIEKLKPVPHRLELIKTETNIILDDSYNASVEGSEVALGVLNSIGKGRKIVVTPGLIELGKNEKQENFNLGKKIAKVADLVIIVNKINFEDIKNGLDAEKFNDENIYQSETLDKAKILLKDFIKKDDVILFENDLPDNYI